jgi:uncharacterized membrane protein
MRQVYFENGLLSYFFSTSFIPHFEHFSSAFVLVMSASIGHTYVWVCVVSVFTAALVSTGGAFVSACLEASELQAAKAAIVRMVIIKFFIV